MAAVNLTKVKRLLATDIFEIVQALAALWLVEVFALTRSGLPPQPVLPKDTPAPEWAHELTFYLVQSHKQRFAIVFIGILKPYARKLGCL